MMIYFHENVVVSKDIPAKIFINGVKSIQKHWHNSLEVILVLSGKIGLDLDNREYSLTANDLVVINSNAIHSLAAITEDNVLLTLQLPLDFLKQMGIDTDTVTFSCKSFLEGNEKQPLYDDLRACLAEIATAYLQKEKYHTIKIKELINHILYQILRFFSVKSTESSKESNQKQLERLSVIINEIKANFNMEITLTEIAEKHQLSRSYFVHFFKTHMGTTFLSYLNNIRLENAYKDLMGTNHSMTQIAVDNGFPNIKAFNKAFKDVFSETPLAYKKRNKQNNLQHLDKKHAYTMNYFEIKSTSQYEMLFQYIAKKREQGEPQSPVLSLAKREICIDKKAKGLAKNPCSMLTFGRAKNGLTAQLQAQLREAQREIGFEYARFHGILDDDMAVYTESADGTPRFNFRFIDHLIDFLLQINLKPFLELAFMPAALAKSRNIIWSGKSIVSMPKSMKKWNQLIEALIDHFIERYGLREVSSWHFEFWNEPEYNGIMWFDGKEAYFSLWKETYRTIKARSEKLSVGGPSCFTTTVTAPWFAAFVAFCKQEDCTPDFLSVHAYPVQGLTSVDLGKMDRILAPFLVENSIDHFNDNIHALSAQAGTSISSDASYLKHEYITMHSAAEKHGWGHLPVYLSEWNATVWQRDLCADTCYESAYIVKNVLENLDHFDSFGYWCLSDYMDEITPSPNIFHGGFGLITTEGIKKAGYYAFAFLSKLGLTAFAQTPDRGNPPPSPDSVTPLASPKPKQLPIFSATSDTLNWKEDKNYTVYIGKTYTIPATSPLRSAITYRSSDETGVSR